MQELNLKDACYELSCPKDRIDKILFKSSEKLKLSLKKYQVPTEFVDSEGKDLSDHKPIMAEFEWTKTL